MLLPSRACPFANKVKENQATLLSLTLSLLSSMHQKHRPASAPCAATATTSSRPGSLTPRVPTRRWRKCWRRRGRGREARRALLLPSPRLRRARPTTATRATPGAAAAAPALLRLLQLLLSPLSAGQSAAGAFAGQPRRLPCPPPRRSSPEAAAAGEEEQRAAAAAAGPPPAGSARTSSSAAPRPTRARASRSRAWCGRRGCAAGTASRS